MTNKTIKDVYFKPIAKIIQEANVGLTTVVVSRETSMDSGRTADVVLVVTPDTFNLFDEHDDFCYDSNPIFIKYEQRYQTLSIYYKLDDKVMYYEVTDNISSLPNHEDLYKFLLVKLEEIANILYGI